MNYDNYKVIADTHFFDDNIRKMEPARHCFKNVEQMNNVLIKSWNDKINDNDEALVLGDFISSKNEEEIKFILNALHGHITLVAGNHDVINLDILRKYPDKILVIEHPIIIDEFWMCSHEPKYVSEAMPYANVFGHVHSNPMYKTVSSRSFCVSAERLNNFEPITFGEIKKAVLSCKD